MYIGAFVSMSCMMLLWIYYTVTYYVHYDTLTIPITLTNWSNVTHTMSGTIYGIHDKFANELHDLYLDINIVNNERLLGVQTMTLSIITHIGRFGRIVHMYPHSSISWWFIKATTFWWYVMAPYDYITSRHLMMSNIRIHDIMQEGLHNYSRDVHADLFCGPPPCHTPSYPKYSHINTMRHMGDLQIQNTNHGTWPDIAQIDIVLVPSFSVGIHSFIRTYPLLYFTFMYMFFFIYIILGFSIVGMRIHKIWRKKKLMM